MLYKNSDNSSVLLTTPSYLPNDDGFSRVSRFIESTLKALGVNFDIFVWESLDELKDFSSHKVYDCALHVHSNALKHLGDKAKSHFNFIHGFENFFPGQGQKRINFFRRKFSLRFLSKATFNLFLSEYCFEKSKALGLQCSYDRDIILNPFYDLSRSNPSQKEKISKSLSFICLIDDSELVSQVAPFMLELLKSIASTTGRTVHFASFYEHPKSELVQTTNLANVKEDVLESFIKSAHFNLLFHEDRAIGLEKYRESIILAAKFGVPSIVSSEGSLSELCHHQNSGWVIKTSREDMVSFLDSLDEKEYLNVSERAYQRAHESFSGEHLVTFLKRVIKV